MNTFEIQTVKENVYTLIVRNNNGNILNVLERGDCRDVRTVKISLFAYIPTKQLSFDNNEIDRFLFL